ncbi:MAG: DUF3795 domain-containing protein [Promethearchaeota archaeon]
MKEIKPEMIREIGCCGVYCATCRKSITGSQCLGCKLGYAEGKRNINRARCKMKLCCFRDKKFETCADCPEYPSCAIIHAFYDKKGVKYKKYKESIEFIRKNGYSKFIEISSSWKGPYGKLK